MIGQAGSRVGGPLLGVILLAACSAGAGSSPPSGEKSTLATLRPNKPSSPGASVEEVVVTRDNPTHPERCRPRAVAKTISGFLSSVTEGDWVALNRFVEDDPEFGWYSVTDGDPQEFTRHFVAYERERLDSYLKARHTKGERLRLLGVDVAYDANRNLGHIAYVLRRRAPDLLEVGITGTLANGKGAVDCQDGRLRVWSMGMDDSPRHARRTLKSLCPLPAAVDWTSSVVACVRRG